MSTAPLVETTEDRLRRELSQSSQAEARESLLREECARLRADNRALMVGGRVARTLDHRLRQTEGLDSLNSHFRAALQRTVKMHHQRHKQYEDVMEKLDLHRSHLDQRRRDLGYESEHG